MADIDTSHLDSDSDKIKPARAALLQAVQRVNDLASTASATKGAGMVGFSESLGYAAGTVGGEINALRTAGESQAINVKDYGAVGDGVIDDTAAIEAADAAACAGNLGLDGVTVIAERAVYFPPGRYKVTNLTFRGAPWLGAGIAATFIDMHGSTGACVNAVGTNSARKQLNISDMTLNGSNATGDAAYGFRLGYNQRSKGALRRVRIDNFPGPAMHFAEQTWMMSFHDVYCSFNANSSGSLRTAIYIDPALGAGTLLALDWYSLDLENNGFIGSSVGGGIDLNSSAVHDWRFYGGTWEGNYGNAEARFVDALGVYIDGLYIESEKASVINGLVFAGGAYGSVRSTRLSGETGMTGDGLKVSGTSGVYVEHVYSNIKWVNDVSVANTAIVTLGGYSAALLFSVANGAVLNRLSANRQQLTDAVTIATNAAQANSFYVTLFDNRTMGAPTNPSIGQRITYTIIQEGSLGGHTLAWNAVFKHGWSNTGNTLNKRSTIAFEYDGTNWNQVGAQSPYV